MHGRIAPFLSFEAHTRRCTHREMKLSNIDRFEMCQLLQTIVVLLLGVQHTLNSESDVRILGVDAMILTVLFVFGAALVMAWYEYLKERDVRRKASQLASS